VGVRSTCLLCEIDLLPGPTPQRQLHPVTDACLVRITDAWGVAVEDAPAPAPAPVLDLRSWEPVDTRLVEIFTGVGLPRLGGQSSGRGWSSFALFQRCPYAWQRRYVTQVTSPILTEAPSLAIGTLVHTYLAVHYARVADPTYPLSPEIVAERLLGCNPEFLATSWRVFAAYRLYYSRETIQPLAVEHDLVDPRTGESCRYDLIAYLPEATLMRPAGTYILEHKTAGRFDGDTLEGWSNDGEVLGQIALWQRLSLDLRFGKLQGVIVNLLGKQKEPQFHRTIVAPESWKVDAHLADLARWEGLIQLARSTGSFPRARNGCIGRYGRCPHFDHCATGEP
jgi:hypothetical protein